MGKATIFAGAAFALILQTAAAAADDADCTPKLLSSLPLIAESDGRYAVDVAIDGAPHRLLLATTSAHSVFFQDFTEGAGLHQHELPERKTFYVLQSKAVGIAVADTLSIAGNTANNVQALVIKNSYAPDAQVVGALGADLLSGFDVDIDFKGAKVNLYAANPCEGKPVYWSKTYTDLAFDGDAGFSVPMTLDGKTLAVRIDTLIPHSQMRMDIANEYFGLTEASPGIVQTGIDDTNHLPVYRYPFGALAAGGLAISKPAIALEGYADAEHCDGKRHSDFGPVPGTHRFHTCHNGGDMSLGMLDLKPTHMYIAYRARRVYLSVASN